MALPAGRYGVTKRQLNKVKNLPVNTIGMIEEAIETSEEYTKDIVGWGNKNKFNYNAWKGIAITKGTGVFENNGVTLTATENDAYTVYSLPNYPENAKIPVKEGEKIKLTWDCDETVQLGGVFIFPNGTVTGAVNTNNLTKQLEYTPTAGVTFITFRVGVYTSGNTIHYKDIMISKDGGAYEPYHASVEESLAEKTDNTVIAPVENGSTASQAYAVGEHFIRDRAFCTCKQAISQGGSFTLNTNYTAGDVASELENSLSVDNTSRMILSSGANLNNLSVGVYECSSTTAVNVSNTPPTLGQKAFMLVVMSQWENENFNRQILFGRSDVDIYTRVAADGVYRDWYKINMTLDSQ